MQHIQWFWDKVEKLTLSLPAAHNIYVTVDHSKEEKLRPHDLNSVEITFHFEYVSKDWTWNYQESLCEADIWAQ